MLEQGLELLELLSYKIFELLGYTNLALLGYRQFSTFRLQKNIALLGHKKI